MIEQAVSSAPTEAARFRRKRDEDKVLREACGQFESLMLHQLLRGMRRTVAEAGLFHGGAGENIWRDLYDQALAEEGSKTGNLGLAEMLYRELKGLKPSPKQIQTLPGSIRPRPALQAAPEISAPAQDSESSDLLLPVEGRLSSFFGLRDHPILGGLRMHSGLDIAAPEGSPVRAAQSGIVVFSGSRDGYGQVVEIDHGQGLTTLYGHNQENLVQEGQLVRQGQVIALVGETGLATGPHVHFETRRQGQAIDPLALVSSAEARQARLDRSGSDQG